MSTSNIKCNKDCISKKVKESFNNSLRFYNHLLIFQMPHLIFCRVFLSYRVWKILHIKVVHFKKYRHQPFVLLFLVLELMLHPGSDGILANSRLRHRGRHFVDVVRADHVIVIRASAITGIARSCDRPFGGRVPYSESGGTLIVELCGKQGVGARHQTSRARRCKTCPR